MATKSGNFSDDDTHRTKKKGRRSINPTDQGHVSSAELPNLPYEIVADILSRLPVKSLLRFRCVAKSWLSLISDPMFIKMHKCMSNHRLIIFGEDPDLSCKCWALDSVYSDIHDNGVELDCPMKESLGEFYVVGSCDGILCLCFQESVIYLWNPFLRESRRLPPFDTDLWWQEEDETEEPYFVYGFGYDHSINDYVVIGMFLVRNMNVYSPVEVNVYTSSTNSWRRLWGYTKDCAPLPSYQGGNGVLVDGALHWISHVRKDGSVWGDDYDIMNLRITALDLADETYREIPLPSYSYYYTNKLVLAFLKGCLCVMINYDESGIIDLWMMKKYRGSWTKLASFPYLENHPLPDIWYRLYQTPLFLSRTDVLLWIFNSVLGLYNLKDATVRSSVVNNFFTRLHDSAICVESLVSLNAER